MCQAVPNNVELKDIDIWFQDEGRFGQQNSISRVWAEKGSRPGLIRQQQFISAYLFAAVCPERDLGVAIALPQTNSEGMALHLTKISKLITETDTPGLL